MYRRRVLAAAGGLGTASIAGCFGLLGDDLTTFEASPAGVDPETAEETGYEETAVRPHEVTEEFATEKVRVTNYMTEHEKAVDMGPLGRQKGAMYIVLSTPQVSVADREFNPVADMETVELVELVASNYDGIGDVEHQADEEIEILDQETVQSRFDARAQFDGSDVDVSLHVSEAVETDEDLLVTVGVYPQLVRDQEEPNILALMENVAESPQTDDWEGGDETDGGDEDGEGGTENGSSDDGGILGTLG